MEILLLVLTAGLPIIKILLFPTRTMGRGGNWTLVGAAMIVGLMMVLWFGMQSFTETSSAVAAAPAGQATGDAATQQAAIDTISKLF